MGWFRLVQNGAVYIYNVGCINYWWHKFHRSSLSMLIGVLMEPSSLLPMQNAWAWGIWQMITAEYTESRKRRKVFSTFLTHTQHVVPRCLRLSELHELSYMDVSRPIGLSMKERKFFSVRSQWPKCVYALA